MTDERRARFKAAAAQLTAGQDLAANLATCRNLAVRAADEGAELFVLPECFAFIGLRMVDKFAVAEVLDLERPGPILTALLEIATSHPMWLIAGGFPERLPEQAELASGDLTHAFNTALVLAPGGEITSEYRKVHLFDVAIPGRAEFRESDCTAPGDQVVVAETALANIGLSICYDLRFPELYREMAIAGGAEIIVVPAAFTAHTGDAHWHTLLRARAIENQCYVIAAAQTGRHNENRESYGHSMIIDPWGAIVAELADGEGLAIGEIDLDIVEKTRTEMPCLEHQVISVGGVTT